MLLKVNDKHLICSFQTYALFFSEKRADGQCGGKMRLLLPWGSTVHCKGKEDPRGSSASHAKGCAHKQGIFLQFTQDWKIKGKEGDSSTTKVQEKSSSGLEATKLCILQHKIILLLEGNTANAPGTQGEYRRNIFICFFLMQFLWISTLQTDCLDLV